MDDIGLPPFQEAPKFSTCQRCEFALGTLNRLLKLHCELVLGTPHALLMLCCKCVFLGLLELPTLLIPRCELVACSWCYTANLCLKLLTCAFAAALCARSWNFWLLLRCEIDLGTSNTLLDATQWISPQDSKHVPDATLWRWSKNL